LKLQEGVVEIFTPYQCSQCKEVFLAETDRDHHMRLQHQGEAEAELQEGEEETEAGLQCIDCQLVFADEEALALHCRAEHSQEHRQIACQV
jgi:hypothetical protein